MHKHRKAQLLTRLLLVSLVLIMVISACGGGLKNDIVGVWRLSSDETWQFFRDGTVSVTNTLFPMSGTYKVVDDTHIQLEFRALAAFFGPQIVTVNIDGNQLQLSSPDFGKMSFSRPSKT